MLLLRERLSDFRENHLQTVLERNKSYIELMVLYVHPKNLQSSSITVKSHRLGLEKKFISKQNNPIAHLHHAPLIAGLT